MAPDASSTCFAHARWSARFLWLHRKYAGGATAPFEVLPSWWTRMWQPWQTTTQFNTVLSQACDGSAGLPH